MEEFVRDVHVYNLLLSLFPSLPDELYLAFVMSTKAHANILRVDPSEALSMPGVVSYIDHSDVPGHNSWGSSPQGKEEIFASSEVLQLTYMYLW